MELKYEEEGFLSPSRVILFTFFAMIALLLGNILFIFTQFYFSLFVHRKSTTY